MFVGSKKEKLEYFVLHARAGLFYRRANGKRMHSERHTPPLQLHIVGGGGGGRDDASALLPTFQLTN